MPPAHSDLGVELPVEEEQQVVQRLVIDDVEVDLESVGLTHAQAMVLEQELREFSTGSVGTKHKVEGMVVLKNGTLAEITMHSTLVLKESLKNRHRR